MPIMLTSYFFLLLFLAVAFAFSFYMSRKLAYRYKNFHTAYSKFDVTVFADVRLHVNGDLTPGTGEKSRYAHRLSLGAFTLSSSDQDFIAAAHKSEGLRNLVVILSAAESWGPSCTFTPGSLQIHITGEQRNQVFKQNADELDRFFNKVEKANSLMETEFTVVTLGSSADNR